jgi:hypothetical protein
MREGGRLMDKVVHFEIPFDDKERALKFYSGIFGWKFNDIPEMNYVLAFSAETDKNNMVTEKGVINGGLFARNKDAKSTLVVIGVKSVDETIKKVTAAGGKIVTPKRSIPNGSYARVADCEGNIIGLADSNRS